MFDRFILASSYKRIQERFNMCYISDEKSYIPSYNIALGQEAYVITNYQTKEIHRFQFGLTGTGKNPHQPIPFVRAEGDKNKNDDPNYTGSKAIFLKKEYSNLIRQQRCLVLADAFVIGLNKTPCVVHLKNKQRPFAFAGIWNTHRDENGNEIMSFAIVTVTANKLLQEMGYKRMPVILYPNQESGWIRPSSTLGDILYMLSSYPANAMNAYPISRRINDITLNDKTLIQPIGRKVITTIPKSAKADTRQEILADDKVVTALVDNMKVSRN